MKIAFHSYQLGGRGSEIALQDYAQYNREILGNESIIVSTSSRDTPVLERLEKEYKVILYPDVWQNDGKNDQLRGTLERIVKEEKVDVFYAIKGGESDGILPTNCKSIAHNIFRMDQPHGNVYAGICKYLCEKYGPQHPYVHHIVPQPKDLISNLRDELGIPHDALVIGRHGGYDTFNLSYVHNVIMNILNKRSDIYFIFLGTQPFGQHERLKFIPWTGDFDRIGKFVNTCDAGIHARTCGEIFSLSVADYSIRNKPLITWPGGRDTGHVYILKDKGIYYNNPNELNSILMDMSQYYIKNKDWNAYNDKYSPENIMKEFKEVFLND